MFEGVFIIERLGPEVQLLVTCCQRAVVATDANRFTGPNFEKHALVSEFDFEASFSRYFELLARWSLRRLTDFEAPGCCSLQPVLYATTHSIRRPERLSRGCSALFSVCTSWFLLPLIPFYPYYQVWPF